jgi:hypothetical protein
VCCLYTVMRRHKCVAGCSCRATRAELLAAGMHGLEGGEVVVVVM